MFVIEPIPEVVLLHELVGYDFLRVTLCQNLTSKITYARSTSSRVS